jgi:uncharacterized membrane protein YfcA
MGIGLTLIICVAMIVTSFLSGIFGMAGGVILIGILLALLPLQTAMVLHGVTQLASNGWRALLWWRDVRWRIAAAYSAGSLIALGLWSITGYVPDKPVAFLLLGLSPFSVRLIPERFRPNPEHMSQSVLYGVLCTGLMMLTGVAGPLLDSFFLGGKLDRRNIMATKSMCQIFGHAVKLAYFSGVITDPGTIDPMVAALAVIASMAGTFLAKPVLTALSDKTYRLWANRIVTGVSSYYSLYGVYLITIPHL